MKCERCSRELELEHHGRRLCAACESRCVTPMRDLLEALLAMPDPE